MVQEPETTKGKVTRTVTKQDDGTTEIGSQGGLTMHSMGRSQSQVDRYWSTLLELIDFAQKNGYDISWS